MENDSPSKKLASTKIIPVQVYTLFPKGIAIQEGVEFERDN